MEPLPAFLGSPGGACSEFTLVEVAIGRTLTIAEIDSASRATIKASVNSRT